MNIYIPSDRCLLFATAAPYSDRFMLSTTAEEHNIRGYRSTLSYKLDYGSLATRLEMKILRMVDEGVWNYVR
jgi:hypothetical protein